MHILLLFTIYASHFFTLFTGITHTFNRSDFQLCMLCMYHHSTLLIIAHYTAYRIDYPQALSYEKSTRTTGITPRNHITNTAMFGELLRSLSACFILICPPIFGHVSHSFTARFQFEGLYRPPNYSRIFPLLLHLRAGRFTLLYGFLYSHHSPS